MHYNTITRKPADALPNPMMFDGQITANPTPEQYAAAGWVDCVPFAVPAGYQAIAGSQRFVEFEGVWHEEWDCESDADIAARQEAARLAAEAAMNDAVISARLQAFAAIAPVLQAHPQPADVILGGMFYRLPDSQNPLILTLWYVRDSDMIAQQLSAHKADGTPVNRSVNLFTGDEVTFDFEAIVEGLKGNQANARKVRKIR